jgi:hypothetical protein
MSKFRVPRSRRRQGFDGQAGFRVGVAGQGWSRLVKVSQAKHFFHAAGLDAKNEGSGGRGEVKRLKSNRVFNSAAHAQIF